MAAIFISYRREDSAGYAGRLFDALALHFGKDEIFMDVDDIKAGEDFVKVIEETANRCQVLLAVIGKTWGTVKGDDGHLRLANPQDFVRAEIAAGLRGKIRVIPILVGGAAMPRAQDLPEDVAPLARIEALAVSDTRFHQDVAQLIEVLSAMIPGKNGRAAAHGEPTDFPLKRTLLAVVALALLLLIPLVWRSRSAAKPNVQGAWQATVKYGWGDTYKEIFKFETDGHTLTGTASYLGAGRGDRGILDGKIDANRIDFTTKSYTELDQKTYEEKHHYTGVVAGNEIRFTLLTDSGYDSRTPEKFIATRVAEAKP